MIFTDVCIITRDLIKVVEFYEKVFDVEAEGDDIHSSFNIGGLTMAVYDRGKAESDMGLDLAESGNGLLTLGFNVEDVEVAHRRIKNLGIAGISEPVLWPWGAKSFNFKDIDGNLIFIRSWPQ